MSITVAQLAVILAKAANARPDVRRASINPAPDDPGLLLVDVYFHTDGRRVQRDARADKLITPDVPPTCGAILDDWLGPMPSDPHQNRRMTRERQERERLLNHTPAQLLTMHEKKMASPPPPPVRETPQRETLEGELPTTIPEQPREASAQEPAPKLTRAQMLAQGMDAQQRHEQYRRQGGKHPDDEETADR